MRPRFITHTGLNLFKVPHRKEEETLGECDTTIQRQIIRIQNRTFTWQENIFPSFVTMLYVFTHILTHNDEQSVPHTNTCVPLKLAVKPCKQMRRQTPRPEAWYSTNRLCCQPLAFHQTKGCFRSHTQPLEFESRPLTDSSDYIGESY